MGWSYKQAQVQGTAAVGTYATLYASPAAKTAVISTLAVCNTATAVATFRVGVMASAGTPAAAEWLFYDVTVGANDTLMFTIGLALQAGRYVRVSSSAATVTFSASVNEET